MSPQSVTFWVELDKNQLRGLQFFRDQTAQGLPGHFDQEFWTSIVLRLAYSSPAIQCFLVAIGAADEAFLLEKSNVTTFRSLSVARYQYALRQYDKAIKSLLQNMNNCKNGSTSVILTASILCTMFEHWHGNHRGAKDHTAAGVQLLQGFSNCMYSSGNCNEDEDVMRMHLSPIILRNSMKLGLNMTAENFTSRTSIDSVPVVTSLVLPQEIATLEEARTQLHSLSEAIILHVGILVDPSLDAPEARSLRKFVPTLDQWYLKSRHLLSVPMCTSNLYRDSCLLSIRYRYLRILLSSAGAKNEMIYDSMLPDFQHLLFLCSQYHKSHAGLTVSRRSYDMTTNLALLRIGCSCREPRIRRRAIKMMFENTRLEGVCPSVICALYAEAVMKIEEAGINEIINAADVLPAKRVRTIGGEYNAGWLQDDAPKESSKRNSPPRYTVFYINQSGSPAQLDRVGSTTRNSFDVDLSGHTLPDVDSPPADEDLNCTDDYKIIKSDTTDSEYGMQDFFLGYQSFSFIDSRDLRVLLSLQRFIMTF